MAIDNMATTLRIKPHQKEEVRKKAIEINKILIKKGLEPVKDSELMHIIIDSGVKMLCVGEDGKITLQEN
jgi:hypothetical protein